MNPQPLLLGLLVLAVMIFIFTSSQLLSPVRHAEQVGDTRAPSGCQWRFLEYHSSAFEASWLLDIIHNQANVCLTMNTTYRQESLVFMNAINASGSNELGSSNCVDETSPQDLPDNVFSWHEYGKFASNLFPVLLCDATPLLLIS